MFLQVRCLHCTNIFYAVVDISFLFNTMFPYQYMLEQNIALSKIHSINKTGRLIDGFAGNLAAQ